MGIGCPFVVSFYAFGLFGGPVYLPVVGVDHCWMVETHPRSSFHHHFQVWACYGVVLCSALAVVLPTSQPVRQGAGFVLHHRSCCSCCCSASDFSSLDCFARCCLHCCCSLLDWAPTLLLRIHPPWSAGFDSSVLFVFRRPLAPRLSV